MTTSSAAASAAASPGRTRGRRARREWPGRLATVLGLLLGVVIIVFPVAGTYFNNYQAYAFAQEQAARRAGTTTPAQQSATLAAARRYNAGLDARLLQDPWGTAEPTSSPAYQAYSRLLGGSTAAVATLRLPTISAELPVFHGTSEWALDRGAGHMYGTALPVGGAGTHAALAAHRGLPNLTGFDRLPEMKVGDQFFVDVAGETLAYRVARVDTVLPTDVARLAPVAGQDLVTLITCTPYGINTHRLLVTGSRIPWSQVDGAAAEWHGFDWSIQSWMWTRIALAAATLLVLAWLVIAWIREDRRRARRLQARRTAALAAKGALS